MNLSTRFRFYSLLNPIALPFRLAHTVAGATPAQLIIAFRVSCHRAIEHDVAVPKLIAYSMESPESLPHHVLVNRAAWTKSNAAYTDRSARSAWEEEAVSWGIWHIPDAEVQALPEVRGRDVIELGCGTAYFSAWLKRLGARRVVGVDITPAQLETARRLDREFGLGLELIEANAEDVPLAAGQFDLAISEYGASIWCDPTLWIPEAARLLRPGGELVFLRNSMLSMLCMPDTGPVTTTLQRPLSALGRMVWEDDDPGVEFHPSTGEMIRILRQAGFEVLDMIELIAPTDATRHPYYDYVSPEWASKWPAEEIWRARKVMATL